MIDYVAYHARGGTPCTISLANPLPDTDTLEQSRALQDVSARAIVDAIYNHLSRGTIDRLIAELLRRTASDLVVR
jgi:hypothetical protein